MGKGLDQTFFKEDIQIQKVHEKVFNLTNPKEMQT